MKSDGLPTGKAKELTNQLQKKIKEALTPYRFKERITAMMYEEATATVLKVIDEHLSPHMELKASDLAQLNLQVYTVDGDPKNLRINVDTMAMMRLLLIAGKEKE